ncbi:excalibur calcium-binding domain-containing protein [Rhodococcus sp. NPDC049939]|uniref:excalibur calcium-binding domain-containing protein n=1 Tax=Rhodococcus sp. NPDC049939 TaxID=3155511 RepID=UPI003401E17F
MRLGSAAAAIAAALTMLAAPATAVADPAPVMPTGVVLDVVDGDTVRVLDAVRGDVTVRILGIDTPEMKKPGHTMGCWGPEATDFARATLQGQPVAVIGDPTQDAFDRYGRTLAYVVRPDGFNYSIEAARVGAAKSYVFDNRPVSRAGEIAEAERQARDGGAGLWGALCSGNTDSHPIAAPAPAPAPVPSGGAAYYKNCTAARAAGAAPIYVGEPGYRSKLDRDNDGVACE